METQQLVTVELMDFFKKRVNDHSSSEMDSSRDYFSKLKNKMMESKYWKRKGFSMNFEYAGCFEAPNMKPWDVKFSPRSNCVIVNDIGTGRILVFDATTKHFKTTLLLPPDVFRPQKLFLEEDYDDQGHDALLLDYEDDLKNYFFSICKFDFKQLLENSLRGLQSNVIWTTHCDCPSSMAVWKKSRKLEDRILVVVSYDDHTIKTFRAQTGEFIQALESDLPGFTIRHPFGIDISSRDGRMFICQTHPARIITMRYEDDKWHIYRLQESDELKIPRALVFDQVSQHVFVSDRYSKGIQVFNKEGDFVNTFRLDENGLLNENQDGLEGICLNDVTGELYLCDWSNRRIIVFK
ncbi:hypothetical protein C9374_005621 [Naegleria lovaniensis]|uniref:Uncharacterized protein n=1 Tax=Naegleria lovaniensis TaxID=51637 RepID=A0AA88GNP7_NAELO|nr:uncharacterized protein C9374_005621 [Naegleria lovaniensis]KAG2382419.1 hypothetical protein C9374_005621 [Naegleria lovaniensis]